MKKSLVSVHNTVVKNNTIDDETDDDSDVDEAKLFSLHVSKAVFPYFSG